MPLCDSSFRLKPLYSWKTASSSSGSDSSKACSGSDSKDDTAKSNNSGPSYRVRSPLQKWSSVGSSSTDKLALWGFNAGSPLHPSSDWTSLCRPITSSTSLFNPSQKAGASWLDGSSSTDKLALWGSNARSTPLFNPSQKAGGSWLAGPSSTDRSPLWGFDPGSTPLFNPSKGGGSSYKNDPWAPLPFVGSSSKDKSVSLFPPSKSPSKSKPSSAFPPVGAFKKSESPSSSWLVGQSDLPLFNSKSTSVVDSSQQDKSTHLDAKSYSLATWVPETTPPSQPIRHSGSSHKVTSLPQAKTNTYKGGSLGEKKMPESSKHSRREPTQRKSTKQSKTEEWKTQPGMRRVAW